jgi:branched-chain amino acid transport system substrate-binding protein
VRRKSILALLVMLVAALALVAAGCGGDDDGGAAGDTGAATDGAGGGEVEALPASSCAPLEYEGEGTPDALIVSDLPRQGSSRLQTDQMTEAIRFILEQRNFQAGDARIAYQDCDDSTAQAAKWDPGKCSQNGNAYAENENLIGIIGTFNSGCAQVIIPIVNQAPGGAIPMISPANTLVNLTASGPGIPEDEPEKYYPTGVRNYARVAPPDKYQGAAMAEFAVDQGIESVYILNDRESYGLGVATNFRNAAEHLGIEVLGFEAYDVTASSYEAQFRQIGGTNPDAVFVGGLIDENAGQLIEDKVKVLGPNNGDVKLLLPDGFTTDAIFDPAEGGTPDARDAFFSVAGVPIDEFKGAGAEFANAFQQEKLGGDPVDPYAIYAAQAAEVMLDAIGQAGADRAGIIEAVFATEVQDGLIGTFSFDENGDPTGAQGAVVGFTIYSGTDALESVTTIVPKAENVEAAAGGAS